MKHILLGIFDYCIDIRHDKILKKALKMGWKVFCEGETGNQYKTRKTWVPVYSWKEGSIWHYIQQRKIAEKYKKEKKNG